MSDQHLIGQIAVRPVLEEGQEPAPGESRPEPGTPVTFDEDLTPAKPSRSPKTPVKPAASAAGHGPAASAAAALAAPGCGARTAPGAAGPTGTAARCRQLRQRRQRRQRPRRRRPRPGTSDWGAADHCARNRDRDTCGAAACDCRGTRCTRGGRGPARPDPRPAHLHGAWCDQAWPAGSRVATVVYPASPTCLPPKDLTTRVTESAVVVEWNVAGHRLQRLSQRRRGAADQCVGRTAPSFEHTGVPFGQEQCYRVRSIAHVDGVSLEGEPSAPHCVTPATSSRRPPRAGSPPCPLPVRSA